MEVRLEYVRREWPLTFAVQLAVDETVRGEYLVTLTEDEYRQVDGTVDPAQLVEATFKFLLDRETPEEILERFSLSDVSKYFPEYPEKIRSYL